VSAGKGGGEGRAENEAHQIEENFWEKLCIPVRKGVGKGFEKGDVVVCSFGKESFQKWLALSKGKKGNSAHGGGGNYWGKKVNPRIREKGGRSRRLPSYIREREIIRIRGEAFAVRNRSISCSWKKGAGRSE